MQPDPIDPDDPINTALAALGRATPPAGMEARIAARMEQHLAGAPSVRLHRTGGILPASLFLRGTLTGAVAMLLLAGLAFATLRPAENRATGIATAEPSSVPSSASPIKIASRESDHPCAPPALLFRTAPRSTAFEQSDARQSSRPRLLTVAYYESYAPSRPAPQLPLTAQERQLAQMVRNADPRQLAALGRAEEARLEAERVADLAAVAQRTSSAVTESSTGNSSLPAGPSSEAGVTATAEPQPAANDTTSPPAANPGTTQEKQ